MNDDPRIEQLEEASQQLQESLKACHDLVAQFRAKLTAKEIDPSPLNDNEPESGAARS